MSNRNRSGSTPADVDGEGDAGDTTGHGAQGVRGQLGPHQGDAHHARRQFVLADGQPGPAQAALADPQRREQDQRGQPDQDDKLGQDVERAEVLPGQRPGLVEGEEPHRVGGGDALRAVGDVLAEEVVPVVEDLVDDLSEAERHQGQVITAQPERRRADDHAEQRAEQAGRDQHDPHRDVDTGEVAVGGELRPEELEGDLVEEARHQPPGRVAADGPEGHEAQVQQAGVADDDVQAEGRHHVDDRLVDGQQREPLVAELVDRGRHEVPEVRVEVVEDEDHDGGDEHTQGPAQPGSYVEPTVRGRWVDHGDVRHDYTFSPTL